MFKYVMSCSASPYGIFGNAARSTLLLSSKRQSLLNKLFDIDAMMSLVTDHQILDVRTVGRLSHPGPRPEPIRNT
jgi:hypothetical protein